jgi:hypothetical protein
LPVVSAPSVGRAGPARRLLPEGCHAELVEASLSLPLPTVNGIVPGTTVWTRVRTAGLEGVMGAWGDPGPLFLSDNPHRANLSLWIGPLETANYWSSNLSSTYEAN